MCVGWGGGGLVCVGACVHVYAYVRERVCVGVCVSVDAGEGVLFSTCLCVLS